MMDVLIKDFPQQLLDALELGKKITYNTQHTAPIQHVLVIGMGGSGIGAAFVDEITSQERKIPLLVCKGYEYPNYIGENSLVICSSYSGNTEETLVGYEFAKSRGAKVVCISSGGALIKRAKEDGNSYAELPNHGAPPRACLGYSLVQQLFILHQFGLISNQFIEDFERAAYVIREDQRLIQERASLIAKSFVGRFPIVYTTERTGAAAVRFRQQLNENAKILCSHHIIPEMNHNELVGWREQPTDFLVLFMTTPDDHSRNTLRMKINQEIINTVTGKIIEVSSKGDSLIEQMMYLVHVGDWISWEVSKLRSVDAIEVKVIDYLKGSLAKTDLEA